MSRPFRQAAALLIPAVAIASVAGAVAHNSHHIGEHPWIDLATRILFAAVAVELGLVFQTRWAHRTKALVFAGSVTGFVGGALMLTLQGTKYSYGVVYGDAGFITAYVTKFAASPHLGDFFYADLPSYYPPLFYWLLGRVAAIGHIEPYAMVKNGLIAVVFLVPLVTYGLWRPLAGRTVGALLAASVLVYQDYDKPAAWLAQTIFIPWWLLFIEERNLGRPTRPIIRAVVGGLLGATIIGLNYYSLFIGVVAFALDYVPYVTANGIRAGARRALSLVPLAAVALAASAPYWLPYLLSMRAPGATPMQNRWFEPWMADLRLPFIEFSLEGALRLAGLVYAVVAYRRDTLAAGLLRLLSASYLWFAFGWLATLLKHPLLSIKTWYLVYQLLALMGLLAVGRLWQARHRFMTEGWSRAIVGALAVLFVFEGQRFPNRDATDLRAVTPPTAWIANLQELMGPTWQGSQILTSFWLELQYVPVYFFLNENPYYAHPAALVTQRGFFVERLGHETDPAILNLAIRHNRYGRIDGLLLNQDRQVRFYRDNFPHPAQPVDVRLAESALVTPYFTKASRDNQFFYRPEAAADPLEGKDLGHLPDAPLERVWNALGSPRMLDLGGVAPGEVGPKTWEALAAVNRPQG